MRRAPMVATGTVLGAAAVMAIPAPGKPQQVALAGNDGVKRAAAKHHRRAAHRHQPAQTSASSSSTSGSQPPAPAPTPAPTAVRAVLGSLVTTQYSQLRVKLTVKGGRITNVGFTTFTATDGHSASIDQQSVPILIRETIAAQSAHIQGVSGATYTSGAYEQSLQAAIDKAGLHA